MAEVKSLGYLTKAFAPLTQGVSNLAAEMGLNATDATKALYDAISAGQDPAHALEFWRPPVRRRSRWHYGYVQRWRRCLLSRIRLVLVSAAPAYCRRFVSDGEARRHNLSGAC